MNSTGANSTTQGKRDVLEALLAEDVLSDAKFDRQGICRWLGISRRQAKTLFSGKRGPKRNEPRDMIMALLAGEGATVGEIADLAQIEDSKVYAAIRRSPGGGLARKGLKE